jgi:hypothetical protein
VIPTRMRILRPGVRVPAPGQPYLPVAHSLAGPRSVFKRSDPGLARLERPAGDPVCVGQSRVSNMGSPTGRSSGSALLPLPVPSRATPSVAGSVRLGPSAVIRSWPVHPSHPLQAFGGPARSSRVPPVLVTSVSVGCHGSMMRLLCHERPVCAHPSLLCRLVSFGPEC